MAEQFDMFSEEVSRDRVVKRDNAKHAKPEHVSMSEEEMVLHLSQTGRYPILTKLVPRAIAPFHVRNTPSAFDAA